MCEGTCGGLGVTGRHRPAQSLVAELPAGVRVEPVTIHLCHVGTEAVRLLDTGGDRKVARSVVNDSDHQRTTCGVELNRTDAQ